MASSSKQAYLAAKYMSGPKADAILAKASGPSKKRKHKSQSAAASSSSSALLLQDDDVPWTSSTADADQNDNEDDAAISRGDVVVASDRSFKKRQNANWETIRAVTPPAPDEQPMVVDTEETPKLAGGILGKEQLSRIRGDPTRSANAAPPPQEEETVYRDKSGRKIDTKAERAAAAREKRIQEEKEAQKMEWGKGVVQRGEQERLRKQLELEKTRDLARYADDKELNETQKEQERWNDPAAAFLTKKRTKGPRKPEYAGPPPPPNRFGIKPGYRWDGVDRSNGFEHKLFQRSNERSRVNLEGYQWRSEDM